MIEGRDSQFAIKYQRIMYNYTFLCNYVTMAAFLLGNTVNTFDTNRHTSLSI